MKAIIIIRTYGMEAYEIARDDLSRQIKERGWEQPIFVFLHPIEFEEIDVVWLDEAMEIEKFAEITRQQKESQ